MITVYLNNLTQSELQRIFGETKPAIIVGAGISSWEPTTLPTGQEFSKGIREALFMTPGHPNISHDDWDFLEELLDNVPFEMIMERCPTQHTIGNLLAQLYSTDEANPVHNALCQLINQQTIHSIITTNYDMALDSALAGGLLHKIIYHHDVPITNNIPNYFKIHGSAHDINTMIYTLTHESEMPKWKRSVMKNFELCG